MAVNTVQAGGFCTVDDIVLNTYYTWLNNQLGLTSMAFRIVSATPLTRVGDVAYGLQIATTATLNQLLCNDALNLGGRVIRLDPLNQDKAGVASNTATGSGGATPLPTQTCGIISFYSSVRGRGGRARMYVPFPPTDASDVATGLPTAGYVTLLQTWGGLLTNAPITVTSQDGMRTIQMVNVVWHRFGHTSTPLLNALGRPYWATQRRRGDLGKANPAVIPL